MRVPPEELGNGTSITVEIVDTAEDLYHHFAHEMARVLRANISQARRTMMILPVGPTGQYRRFATLCNRERLDCRNLVVVGMDEYLGEDGMLVPEDHPLSFRTFLRRELIARLDPTLRPPDAQVIFPDPVRLEAVDEAIGRYGPVDVAFGGVGMNGHIAFNEPEPELEATAFAALGTRIVVLQTMTRVVNAITAAAGSVDAVPTRAVTVGMRQILAARRLRFYLNRDWQPTVVRRLLYGPVSPAFPASFLRTHGDVGLVLTQHAARLPEARLQ